MGQNTPRMEPLNNMVAEGIPVSAAAMAAWRRLIGSGGRTNFLAVHFFDGAELIDFDAWTCSGTRCARRLICEALESCVLCRKTGGMCLGNYALWRSSHS